MKNNVKTLMISLFAVMITIGLLSGLPVAAYLNAAEIDGLYNTGIDDFGAPLSEGVEDPHWMIIDSTQNPPPELPLPAVVISYPHPSWMQNTNDSKWLWQQHDGQPTEETLTFRTAFTIGEGVDLDSVNISGRWSTDDDGLDILVNGLSTGQMSEWEGYWGWTNFILNTGFVSGLNNIDFIVRDNGNVAGFRAEFLDVFIAPSGDDDPVVFSGTVNRYEVGGSKSPVANGKFSLYDRAYELLEVVNTDENGRFTYTTSSNQSGVYVLVADKERGTLLLNDASGFSSGQLYRLSPYKDNELNYLLNGFTAETNGLQIVGAVVDTNGGSVAGASIRYIDEVAVTGVDGSFSFFIDSDWLRYHSPSFSVVKSGYHRGSFYTNTMGAQATQSLLLNGFIDAGDVTLVPIAADTPIETGSVTAWNRTAKRGDTVQVTVQYQTNVSLPAAALTVIVPEGVVIVPNSANNAAAIVIGETLTLTETVEAGDSKSLLFWVRPEESLVGNGFTIEAFLESVSGAKTGKWRIGGDAVILAGLSLEVPKEINIDQDGHSLPFTVRGEASALDGYTVDIFINDPKGDRALLSRELTGLSTKNTYGRYQSQGVSIQNAEGNPGEYTVTAMLLDPSGEALDVKEAKIYVAPNATVVTSIRAWSNYFDLKAPTPVTASSYVASAIYRDMDGNNRDPLNIEVGLENVSGVAEARFVAKTSAGIFTATETEIVYMEEGHGVFRGYFEPGSIAGTNVNVGLQLSRMEQDNAGDKDLEPKIAEYDYHLPDGYVGVKYSFPLFAYSGFDLTWSQLNIEEIIPGLTVKNDPSLGSNWGRISGTPTQVGSYTLLVMVKNKSGKYDVRGFGINIRNQTEPKIQWKQLKDGVVEKGYGDTITADGGGLEWSIEGDLPPGLSMYLPACDNTCNITGKPRAEGLKKLYRFYVKVKNSLGVDDAYFSIYIDETGEPLTITTESLSTGRVNKDYRTRVSARTAVSYDSDINWSAYGLPEGLNMSSYGWSGSINGTPKEAGTFYVKIQANGVINGKVETAWKDFLLIIKDENESDDFDDTTDVTKHSTIDDPSGYVFDIVTSERIEGATALLQVKNESGEWVNWDAENFYQHNPQTTDLEGAYGWYVPEGQYRVLVSVEGYEDYTTDLDPQYGVINVLPPRDDIFIGLTKCHVPVVLDGITVTLPTKTEYTVGEVLNLSGMVVTAIYSDGNSSAVTGYSTDPLNGAILSIVGLQNVTVSYEGKTNTFTVTVNEAPEAEPELQITGYTLVKSTRVGLTAYDYELTAHVINRGGAAENVTATLTGYQPGIVTVTNGVIEFGDIPAGGTAEGNFIIRIPINKQALYDESQLSFTLDYSPR